MIKKSTRLLFILMVCTLSFSYAQSPTFTKQANINPNRVYVDSFMKAPVSRSPRTFATNKDSIGQMWFNPDSVKLFGRFPGNVIKAVATEDTIRALRTAIASGGTTPTLNSVLTAGNTSSHVLNLTSGSLDVANGLNLFNGSEDIVLQKRAAGSSVSELRLASNGSIQVSPGPSASPAITITSTTSTFAGNVTGTALGSFTRLVAYQGNNAGFNKYVTLGTDPTDTTKQLWAIGLQNAAGGSPIHTGGELTFRSFTTAGVVLNAGALSINRLGLVRIPATSNNNGLFVGTGTGAYSGLLTVSGTAGLAVNGVGGVSMEGPLKHGASLTQNQSVTITGDYTVQATDLYIYVNATVDITITLPLITTSVGTQGRVLYIKKIINNSANITLQPVSSQLIDLAANYAFANYKASIMLHDDGTQWFVH